MLLRGCLLRQKNGIFLWISLDVLDFPLDIQDFYLGKNQAKLRGKSGTIISTGLCG